MQSQLIDALKHSTADYADIRISVEDGLNLAFRGIEAEQASAWSGQGGVVRACTRGGWGIVSFDSLSDLPRRVEEACRCAALVGRERTALANVPIITETRPAQLTTDFRGVSLDETGCWGQGNCGQRTGTGKQLAPETGTEKTLTQCL